MSHVAPSPRTEIHRKAQRAHYDLATVHAIVDQALVCHIAFNQGGSVHCLPTACWREGDFLYVHGANNSRLVHTLLDGECAVCITHLDGLVLARSAFHHSMNYRSVAIYGRFQAVDEVEAKEAAFKAFVEHVSPGRAAQVRLPSRAELAGTRLLRLPLAEAAAKIRNWGVEDSEGDMAIPVWAGVIPLALRAGAPVPEVGGEAYSLPAHPGFIEASN
ncbi:pyridoxamine 5'-phosphate oxidase family protein [Zoogloea sp. LCSB751]|uniref:pyridoxamine 5'-phosphate oxidase family protein n=1 Tax=Zoogloea sp. LCSB751 TaxID=1965277 RepID=UPI001115D96B|nr:pyridoxamine 5'-phosphate oxidase family protein [Zoogloea sp. LCSB751]